MLNFSLKKRPVIDEASRNWLLDAFAWALRNADADAFYRQTQLIPPTPEFFPDRCQSASDMATSVLRRMLNYSHLEHWPFAMLDAPDFAPLNNIEPVVAAPISRHPPHSIADADQLPALPLTFLPPQLKNPEALIGSLAQGISYYLATQIREHPPGGQQFLPQAIDVLAIFLGFGIMLANSAYTFRGGCGSCYNPLAVRQASLTETDTLYALALFCELKGVPASAAKPHLKKHLRAQLGRACAEIKSEDYVTPLKKYYLGT